MRIDKLQQDYVPPSYSQAPLTAAEDEKLAQKIYSEGLDQILEQLDHSIKDEKEFMKFARLVNPFLTWFGTDKLKKAENMLSNLQYQKGRIIEYSSEIILRNALQEMREGIGILFNHFLCF